MTEILESYVGWWTRRPGRVWHLVESEITDRTVTRCGRQMRFETSAGALAFSQYPPGERCEQCTGRIVAD